MLLDEKKKLARVNLRLRDKHETYILKNELIQLTSKIYG